MNHSGHNFGLVWFTCITLAPALATLTNLLTRHSILSVSCRIEALSAMMQTQFQAPPATTLLGLDYPLQLLLRKRPVPRSPQP